MRFYEVDEARDHARRGQHRRHEQGRAALADGHGPTGCLLFGGTIAENIAYGADSPTREQIVAAARATYVDRLFKPSQWLMKRSSMKKDLNVRAWGSGS